VEEILVEKSTDIYIHLYICGKIRKIALLFPKISQTELFPAIRGK